MSKVVITTLDQPKPMSGRSSRWKTVKAANGDRIRLRVLDAESDAFADDLLHAFRANVRRAREENRKVSAKV